MPPFRWNVVLTTGITLHPWQARNTRAHCGTKVRLSRGKVLDAARTLFLARGYDGTTITAIASGARVSVQTVYNTVGSKAEVLKASYDVALAGDDEPVAIRDRPAFRAMAAETDGRRFLARYAALGVR